MSEQFPTADLALPYRAIPRVDQQFMVDQDSYLDIMLPSTANHLARLRLHDINERWIQAIDLSAHQGYVPEGDALLNEPHGVFDEFDLDEEFIIGRDHNPDNLPALNSLTVSRAHLSLRVGLGERGLILAIKDLSSHNGTEIVMNETLRRYVQPAQDLVFSY